MNFALRVDESVQLQLFEDTHARELFELVDSCREYLRDWLPWVDDTTSVDDSVEFIHQAQKNFGRGKSVQTGMVYDGELCGAIGLHIDGDTGELGYWLHPDWQGNGVVTRSVRGLVDFGFHHRRLHRLIIRAAPENDKSWAIPERLGFTHEGTLREAGATGDGYVDLKLYALLRREWRERRRDG